MTAHSLYALQALVLTIAVLSGHAPPWLAAGRVFAAGSTGLGLMSTALSVGTAAGTLTAARGPAPGTRKVVIGAIAFGLAESVAAAAPDYGSFLALLAPVGFALMTLNTAVSAYAQTRIEEAVRGRVMAFYTVIPMGGTPIGGPLVGWASQHAGRDEAWSAARWWPWPERRRSPGGCGARTPT